MRRPGEFFQVKGDEGCRNLLHVINLQVLSDMNLMRDEIFITARGRTVREPPHLNQIVELVERGSLTEANEDESRRLMLSRRATEACRNEFDR